MVEVREERAAPLVVERRQQVLVAAERVGDHRVERLDQPDDDVGVVVGVARLAAAARGRAVELHPDAEAPRAAVGVRPRGDRLGEQAAAPAQLAVALE